MKIIKNILLILITFLPVVLLIYYLLIKLNIIATDPKAQPFEIIADMDHHKKLLPQSTSDFFPDSSAFRYPVLGTVPRFGSFYKFEMTEYEKAESTFTNPIENSDFVLQRGKNRFQALCVPCHNQDGKGKGLIITKVQLKEGEEGFPEPADLTSKNTRNYSDARLFHILSAGQNLMYPISNRVNEIDRWCLVHYIRFLQKQVQDSTNE